MDWTKKVKVLQVPAFSQYVPQAEALFSFLSKADILSDGDFVSNDEYVILPGFCDVHVHFREPGFSYKETIRSGSMAAARGGYTAVCTMPNLNPVPDTVENLKAQQDIIDRDAAVAVYPYGSITVGQKGEQLADLAGMAPNCVGFSDDGHGVQSEAMMREAMTWAKKLGKVIAAHCEQNDLLHGGYIHDGAYAKAHGHKGICSESEWAPIARDIELVKETGCAYHVCHISCQESVDLIRKAKRDGVNITCETGPHYLLMNENDLREEGRFKMNPPVRALEDQQALLEGLQDGTIDMIATDHAPHSAEEKAKGLAGSAFGVVGLETAFPLLYTGLVKKNVISLDQLVQLMAVAPRKRFNIPMAEGYVLWNLSTKSIINPADFLSKGKATPFEGQTIFAQNLLTVLNGHIVYAK